MKTLKIGTRDSILALWQARKVQQLLTIQNIASELVSIKTQGDLILDKSLPSIGGKGLFTAELDEMMLNGDIDIAVHSLKDLPVEENKNIHVAAVLQRDDERDCFVIRRNKNTLDYNCIATSSSRRKAFLLHQFPNIQVENIRGNVQTRLRKLNESHWDAAVFAAAGLKRLAMDDFIFAYADFMIPAPAQGIIAITALRNNVVLHNILQQINHLETMQCAVVERQFLHGLGGGCSSPVGAFCTFNSNKYSMKAAVLTIDGTKKIDIAVEDFDKTNCYTKAIEQAKAMNVNEIMQYNEKMAEKL